MKLHEEIFQVNGIAMNVASVGAGPVVLLLHGFPDTHAVWRKQIEALVKAGYQVVAPDLRGYGRTDAPAGVAAYSLDILCDDIIGLLDVLGFDRVYLVGHDWGAVIGWHVCMRAPERVERFAALSAGHPLAYAGAGLEQLLKAWYAVVFQLPWISEKLLMAGDLRALQAHAADEAQLADWRANFAGEGRVTAALNYYRANVNLIAAASPTPLPGPILGIWSQGDPALTEGQMRNSAKYIAGSFRYECVTGKAGHWVQLTESELVNRLLIDFGNAPSVC